MHQKRCLHLRRKVRSSPCEREGGEAGGVCRGHLVTQQYQGMSQCPWDTQVLACSVAQGGWCSDESFELFDQLGCSRLFWLHWIAVPSPKNMTLLDLGTLQSSSSPGPTRPARMGIKNKMPMKWPSLQSPKGWELLLQTKAKLSSYRSLPNPTNQLHIN